MARGFEHQSFIAGDMPDKPAGKMRHDAADLSRKTRSGSHAPSSRSVGTVFVQPARCWALWPGAAKGGRPVDERDVFLSAFAHGLAIRRRSA